MVMEPSLLFLDEPTSGLDSASSLLLLRALKREAYEGVNICMVVHQPSYALFNMFDDLVLLAKGGFMVYHGLVEKVEAYFGSLGYTVPDRISPPDYYIDILEIAKQRLREAKLQATDYLILLLAGACVGSITKISDADFGAFGYSYTIIAIFAALRSFSNDKLQYWRERGSGISRLAHFAAKDTFDHFNTLIKPAVYLSMFYFFTNPRSSFLDNYIVLVSLVYCVTGMGYALAIFLGPGPSQLFSVLLPVCLTLVTTQALSNDNLKFVANFCYPKWALEALVIANARRYYGVWLISRCVALYKFQYSLHVWGFCIMILILFGVGSRIIAFIGLLTVQRR